MPHAFLVATTTNSNDALTSSATQDNESSRTTTTTRIAGFIELGTMPSPVTIEKEWQGVKIATRPELPYVANLVVEESFRRQKLGYTMIQLALKIAKKWCQGPDTSSSSSSFSPFLFLSVDQDNHGALAFYKRLGFEEMRLPQEKLAGKVYLEKKLSS